MKYVEGRCAAESNSWKLFASLAVGAVLASAGGGGAIAQTASAAPSSQAASTATSAQPAKAVADPGDKVICKYEEGDTGSLLNGRTKVCRTKRDWDQINKDARSLVDVKVDPDRRGK